MYSLFSLQDIDGGSLKARIFALDSLFNLNVYGIGVLTNEQAFLSPSSVYHAVFSNADPLLLFTIVTLDEIAVSQPWSDQLMINNAIRFYFKKRGLTSLLRVYSGINQVIYQGDLDLLAQHVSPANFFNGDESLLKNALNENTRILDEKASVYGARSITASQFQHTC